MTNTRRVTRFEMWLCDVADAVSLVLALAAIAGVLWVISTGRF